MEIAIGILLVIGLWLLSLHHAFKRGALIGFCAREHVSPILINVEEHGGQMMMYDYVDSCFLGQVSTTDEIKPWLAKKFPEKNVLVVSTKGMV